MSRIIGQAINLCYVGSSNLIANKENEDWKFICRVAKFGQSYGYKAAVEAFGISKSTYYNYVNLYNSCIENNVEFAFNSRRPINVRKNQWDKRIVNFIRNIREKHPNIGKCKIKLYLDQYCLVKNILPISTGTIQNIMNSFPNKLRTKTITLAIKRRSNVVRKPKNYKPKKSGECLALDSMEFRRNGKKLYVVVAQDEATGLLYAEATTSHTSRSAKNILDNAHNYLPWQNFNTVLTDNGSEFAKDFAKFLKQNNVTHYHTYPKTPKQNARCERVNRTIQDEFMIRYANLLFDDINAFNKRLLKYLHWFNFRRVHYRFNNKMTPFQYHLQLVEQGQIIC
jgi:transposase InsO family protein